MNTILPNSKFDPVPLETVSEMSAQGTVMSRSPTADALAPSSLPPAVSVLGSLTPKSRVHELCQARGLTAVYLTPPFFVDGGDRVKFQSELILSDGDGHEVARIKGGFHPRKRDAEHAAAEKFLQSEERERDVTSDMRRKAVELLQAAAAAAFILDPDLSGTVKEGSFNPYGNGQFVASWSDTYAGVGDRYSQVSSVSGTNSVVTLLLTVAYKTIDTVNGMGGTFSLQCFHNTLDNWTIVASNYSSDSLDPLSIQKVLVAVPLIARQLSSAMSLTTFQIPVRFYWPSGYRLFTGFHHNGSGCDTHISVSLADHVSVPQYSLSVSPSEGSVWKGDITNQLVRISSLGADQVIPVVVQEPVSISGGVQSVISSVAPGVEVPVRAVEGAVLPISAVDPLHVVVDGTVPVSVGDSTTVYPGPGTKWEVVSSPSAPLAVKTMSTVACDIVANTATGPVWVSYEKTPPEEPDSSADPDLSGTVLEGSFNPYGNGQPGVADRIAFPASTAVGDGGVTFDALRSSNPDDWFNCINADNVQAFAIEGVSQLESTSQRWCSARIEPDVWPFVPVFAIDDPVPPSLRPHVGKSSPQSRAAGGSGVTKDRAKALAVQLDRVSERVSRRAQTWSDVCDWILSAGDPDPAVVKAVMRAFEKKSTGEGGSDRKLAVMLAKGSSQRDTFRGLTRYSTVLTALSGCEAFQDWVGVHFSGVTPRVPRTSAPEATLQSMMDNGCTLDELPPPSETDADYSQLRVLTKQDIIDQVDTSGVHREGFNAYGNQQIPSAKGDGYAAALAAGRNRAMHSLHGNTTPVRFPSSMTEIDALPTFKSVAQMDGVLGGKLVDPVAVLSNVSGLAGANGLNGGDVSSEMVIRAPVVRSNNTIDPTTCIGPPEAYLWPCKVRRPTDNALIDPNVGPPIFAVQCVPRPFVSTLEDSVEFVRLAGLEAEGRAPRSNQTSTGGFRVADLLRIARIASEDHGDSLQSVLLKLWLLEMSIGWHGDVPDLPLTGQAGKFDSRSRLANVVAKQTSYNTPDTYFGLSCGMANAYFPFDTDGAMVHPNVYGTLRFHITVDTVPEDESYFFLPRSVLAGDAAGGQKYLALFIMSLSPYPSGIHTVSMMNENANQIRRDRVSYIPFSSLVVVPGTRRLNIILPVKNHAAVNYGGFTDAQAASYVQMNPRVGPVGANGLPALDVIHICSPTADHVVQLGPYIYSWLGQSDAATSPIHTADIAAFRNHLCQTTRRAGDNDFCRELAAVLSVRYPAMIAMEPGHDEYLLDPTTTAAYECQSVFGLSPARMSNHAPIRVEQSDFTLAALSYLWWNKIAAGVKVSVPDSGSYPIRPTLYDGNPRLVQYAGVIARTYAITSQLVFAKEMQSVSTWNGIFQNLSNSAVVRHLARYFANPLSAVGYINVSDLGEDVNRLHSVVNGCSAALDNWNFGVFDYMNLPQVGILPTYDMDDAMLLQPTPCILPDIFLHLGACELIKGLAPFVGPRKGLCGLWTSDAVIQDLPGPALSVPGPVGASTNVVARSTKPQYDDATSFNNRLVWHCYDANIFQPGIGPVIAGFPGPGHMICSKYQLGDYYSTGWVQGSILSACTTWIPYMENSGRKVVVGVLKAGGNATDMTQLMAGVIQKSVDVWMVRDVHIQPNTILSVAPDQTDDWFKGRRSTKNSMASSAPVPETGVSPETSETS